MHLRGLMITYSAEVSWADTESCSPPDPASKCPIQSMGEIVDVPRDGYWQKITTTALFVHAPPRRVEIHLCYGCDTGRREWQKGRQLKAELLAVWCDISITWGCWEPTHWTFWSITELWDWNYSITFSTRNSNQK